jgi:hypothetical protein
MSWYVEAIGKVPAVAQAVELQFAQSSGYQEPEETIRQQARTTIAAVLAAQSEGAVVKVRASGSQSTNYKGGGASGYVNTLNISVEPQFNFVE